MEAVSQLVAPSRSRERCVGCLQFCTGDCDRDRTVDVGELVRGTRIALGLDPASSCFTPGPQHVLGIADLIVAVNNALFGCPDLTPRATPTSTPPPPATPSPRSTVSRDNEIGATFLADARTVCGGRTSLFEDAFGLSCEPGRGHRLRWSARVFPSAEDALADFESRLVGWDVAEADFHGYRSASWSPPGIIAQHRYDNFVWVADCIVVSSNSFNDTPLTSLPDLETASERMLDWVEEYLLPQCPADEGRMCAPARHDLR
jgi:hypothetical protein